MDFEQAQQMIQQNNAWSAQQAQKQMEFQAEMSNSSHVREVADLKAAGLNPVLSAKLGGASTPSGAMGDTDTSGTSALISMAMQTASAAGSAARAAANATERTGIMGELVNGLEGIIKYLPFKLRAPAYAVVQAFDFYTNHSSGEIDMSKILTGNLNSASGSAKKDEELEKKFDLGQAIEDAKRYGKAYLLDKNNELGLQRYDGRKLLDMDQTYKRGYPVYYIVDSNGKKHYIDAFN